MWAHQIKTPIAAMRLLLQEQDIPEFRELSAELFQIEQYVEMILKTSPVTADSSDDGGYNEITADRPFPDWNLPVS